MLEISGDAPLFLISLASETNSSGSSP
jgi:hypothetical protein